jgi:hypothetical protein
MIKIKELIKLKKKVYIHEYIKIGWFRFCFYRLGNKFTIRLELSRGWEN